MKTLKTLPPHARLFWINKSPRKIYGNLNEKKLCINKKFWGAVKPVLSNKVVSNEKSLLLNRATL